MKLTQYLSLPIRYLEYKMNRVHPIWCTFAITENCNAMCQYCDFWETQKEDMTTEQIHHCLRQMKKLGLCGVVYSGGEVMLRKDLVDIVRYTIGLGMDATVVTAGTVIRKDVFHDLMQAGLKRLTFSLDGSTAEVHGKLRKACDFDKVIRGIKLAVRIKNENNFKTRVSLTSVVHQINRHDLKNIHDLRVELGMDKNYFQPIWPFMGGQDVHEDHGFTGVGREELDEVVQELAEIPDGNLKEYYELLPNLYRSFSKVKEQYECFGGRAFVYIDSKGKVYPCSPLHDKPMGSLLDDTIEEIVSRPETKSILGFAKNWECGGCTMACYQEKNVVLSGAMNPLKVLKRAS